MTLQAIPYLCRQENSTVARDSLRGAAELVRKLIKSAENSATVRVNSDGQTCEHGIDIVHVHYVLADACVEFDPMPTHIEYHLPQEDDSIVSISVDRPSSDPTLLEDEQ